MHTLNIQSLRKKIEKKIVLKDINLELFTGDSFCLLGKNDSGKTLLLDIFFGIKKPDSGKVLLRNKEVSLPESREKSSYIPQKSSFHDHLTPYEYITITGELFDLEKKKVKKQGHKCLQLAKLNEDTWNIPCGYLSENEKRKLRIAISLMNDPKIIFLDAPFDSIDPLEKKDLHELLTALKKEGKDLFITSSTGKDVEDLCDRVGIIHEGKMIVNDTLKNIIPRGKTLIEVYEEAISPKKKVKKTSRRGSPKGATAKKVTSPKTIATKKTAASKKKPASKMKK